MRATGSTMSRFDKQCAVKSLGMPHSRRDNAVRGNPPTPTRIKNTRRQAGGILYVIFYKRFFWYSVPHFSIAVNIGRID